MNAKMPRITRINKDIVGQYYSSLVEQPSRVLVESTQDDLGHLHERLDDLADQSFSFSFFVLGERVFGRDFLKKEITEMVLKKQLEMVMIELSLIESVDDGDIIYKMLLEQCNEISKKLGSAIPEDIVGKGPVFDRKDLLSVIGEEFPTTVVVVDGFDELIDRLIKSGRRNLDLANDIMTSILSLNDVTIRNEIKGFGLLVFASPRLFSHPDIGLRKEKLGIYMELVEDEETKLESGRTLLRIYDEKKNTPYSSTFLDPQILEIMSAEPRSTFMNPFRILEKLDSERKKLVPGRPSRAHVKLIKDVVREIGKEDKRTYAIKRELLENLNSLGFVDTVSVLSDLLEQKLGELDRAFDEELKEALEAANLECEGSFPSYVVKDTESGTSMKVDVPTPFVYAKIDGVQATNKYPTGIVREIEEKFQQIREARAVSLSNDQFAELFLSTLNMFRVATNDDTIVIDRLLEMVANNLSAMSLRTTGNDDFDAVDSLRNKLSQKEVWEKLIEQNWIPESGKVGGVEVMGKKYTILVWRG